MGDWVAVAVTGTDDPDKVQLAVYPVMLVPVTAVGAVKAMLSCALPAVTVTLLGALGTVAVAAHTALLAFTSIKARPKDLQRMTSG
jgi:hypothetical protein